MANPNILSASSITGNVVYSAPANTSATTLISNASSSGVVYKVESLTCANVTGAAATATVSVNSAAAGGGTAYRLIYQVQVPANGTLQVIDKSTPVYLTENTSIVVTSGTSSAIEYVCSYESVS